MVEKLVNVFWSEELGLNCVDGRELWKALKIEKPYSDWIKDQLRRVGAMKGSDFKVFHFKVKNSSSGGRPTEDYIVALDIAKEICMITGAAPRTNKETKKISKEIRQYFIECERQLSKEQKEKVDQLMEEKRNRTVTVHQRNLISSSVNLKADESQNSAEEAKKIRNFIFSKYGIKSYGEIKEVDMPEILQIINKWKVDGRKNNLFNLIGQEATHDS